MTEHAVVTTTTDSEAAAVALARGLVEARLAACVQVSGPVRSVYRWDGAVQDEQEWQLWVKTRAALVEQVTAWVHEHHGYDVPELLVLPATGSEPYLRWLDEETT